MIYIYIYIAVLLPFSIFEKPDVAESKQQPVTENTSRNMQVRVKSIWFNK